MHPKNPHRERYDFNLLIQSSPELKSHVVPSRAGDQTINFDDQEAVKSLNRALLKHYYGIQYWDIPQDFLCPPIPGRADYIHHIADLFPENKKLRGLDIGVGANCIYPLLGHKSYGWTFVASDVETSALNSAANILKNNDLESRIELRLQKQPSKIFDGIIKAGERFDFSLCNPPFHSSLEDALAGTERKRRNLGLPGKRKLNFGGKSNELWCKGGEKTFLLQMIEESKVFASSVTWFTSLVSKSENLPPLEQKLKSLSCPTVKIIPMELGQKKSRILAWSFLKSF